MFSEHKGDFVMINYVPFLKTKNYEFKALSQLRQEIKTHIIPFLDIHRKEKEYDEETYKNHIMYVKTKILKSEIYQFYIDDIDINTNFCINRRCSYDYLMKNFFDISYIPVLGIHRIKERQEIIFSNAEFVKTSTVAIRINVTDLAIPMVKDKLEDIATKLSPIYSNIHLIIDCRYCEQKDIETYSQIISKYIYEVKILFSKIIITGSSLPVSFSEIKLHNIKEIERTEIMIWKKCSSRITLHFGDYTLVPVSYYDKPRQLYYPTITAHIIYTYADKFVIYRGGRLSKEGYEQYKDICIRISQEPFFRGDKYSSGDYFLAHSTSYSKNIMPGTILAPTINSHITYMYDGFKL